MPIAEKTADRRIQRTRALLLESLVRLIQDRGYERLTIQNILDLSGVGRATFYSHFDSKDALLEASIGGLRAWLVREAAARPSERLGFSRPFFEHLESHAQIYRMTAGKRGEVTVGRLIRRMLREMTQADVAAHAPRHGAVMPVAMVTEYIVGALWSTVVWWMTSETPLPAADVDRMFRHLAFAGMPDAASATH